MAGGGPSSGLSFGSGIAQGLASVYSAKRQNDNDTARAREDRDRQNSLFLIDHLIQSGRVADYADLQPLFDTALGLKGQKPKKGEADVHDILSRVLAPTFPGGGAAAPAGGQAAAGGAPAPTAPPTGTDASGLMSPSGALGGGGGEDAATAPAGAPSPAAGPAGPQTQTLGGVKLLTPEGAADVESALTTRKFAAQTQRARELYESFKAMDPDFTLRDALRAAGFDVDIYRGAKGGATSLSQMGSFGAFLAKKQAEKGATGDTAPLSSDEVLTARTEFYAANRSMGVNREALARADYGKAFTLLTPEEQAVVVKKETSLIGDQSYARGAAGNKADFDAPLTPGQAMSTSLPVGATGPQLVGQGVLTQPEIENRRSTETLRDTLTDIRDRLIDPALPGKDDLGGLLPGAYLAVKRRSKDGREPIAALEAAVNNVVNVVARTVAQQKGTQTEKDAARAEAAIVSLQDAIVSGDTRESAKTRINESLRIIEDVLKKLPTQAAPQGSNAPAAPVDPSMTSSGVNRRNRARQTLLSGGYQTDDKTIDVFLKNNPGFK